MTATFRPVGALGLICAALTLVLCAQSDAQAAELRLQSQLIWGTDDSKPPEGKDYKPVEPAIQKKLKELPLKWKNYFEVKHIDFSVTPAVMKKVPLSDKCELNVLNQANSLIEVSLIGKGKEVVKRTQSLPKGEILVLGGNAPNATAWLVVLKRVD
ncbi:MAG TPA: hypothetical protein VKY92_15250 [Verrucomicrobiae bacterium]|jgi:hypothetical protein|nr:hypothetical protein [Verrucomicrobiae bacterium]